MPADHTGKAPEGHFPARYWKMLDAGRVGAEAAAGAAGGLGLKWSTRARSRARASVLALLLVLPPSNAWATDPPEFILQWGSNGSGDGQFAGAHGIEVDAGGNVYAVDT